MKFAETELPGIGEALVNVNEESKASFVEYFNNLDERVSAFKTTTQGLEGGFFAQPADLETAKKLLELTGDISKLETDRVNSGLTELEVRNKSLDLIRETFGLNEKLFNLSADQANDTINYYAAIERGDKKAADTLKARIDARNEEAEAINSVASAIL